jgi:hypothetical protein
METDKILKLTILKVNFIKKHIDSLLDAEKAELDIVHPDDLIDNKKLKIAACKMIRMRLTEIYALVEKVEEMEREDILNIETSIDESML